MEGFLKICVLSTLIGSIYLTREYIAINRDRADDPDKTAEATGCGYPGYSPYLKPGLSKMYHHTAHLHTTYMTEAYISEEFTKTLGGLGAGDSADVLGRSKTFIKNRWPNLRSANVAKLSRTLKMTAGLVNLIGGMSPVLGTFCAVFGAIQGVRTPTHHDILDATNKALNKIAEEVDIKLADLKKYVEEKIHEANKDQTVFNYKFLVSYWSSCSEQVTENDRIACQKQAVSLGLASRDRFLLHHDLLKDTEAKFQENLLDDSKRRGIEVGLLYFRNYAVWLNMVLKSLRRQYEKAYTDEPGSPATAMTCQEFSIKEANNEGAGLSRNLKYHCAYHEELLSQAIYFEKYAVAAVETVKIVAMNRFDKTLSFDITNEYSERADSLPNSIVASTRAECKATIHKNKESKCGYDVQVQGNYLRNGTGVRDYERLTSSSYSRDGLLSEGYKIDTELEDGELIASSPEDQTEKTAKEWCQNRVEKRRQEYMKMEQVDLERYWSQEVVKVAKCARLLATGEVQDCFDSTMQKYEPKAFGTVLDLTNAEGTSEAGTSEENAKMAKKAIDTSLSTPYVSSSTRQQSWWRAELVKPAFVKEIHIYAWKLGGKGECIKTTEGNAGGACCKFPFSYKETMYTSCAVEGYDKPWCYTTKGNYWGYCDLPTQYIDVDSGKCDNGYLSEEECQAIADNLGTSLTVRTSNDKPPGCYVTSSKFYFNSESTSQDECTRDKVCKCKPDLYSTLKVETIAGGVTTECLPETPFPKFPSSYDEPLIVSCPFFPFDKTTQPQEKIKISIDNRKIKPSSHRLYLAEVRAFGVLPSNWDSDTTPAEGSNPLYIDVDSDKCGPGYILDLAECKEIADRQGKTLHTMTNAKRPSGCFVRTSTNWLWFNRESSSQAGCTTARVCKCKPAATVLVDLTAPTQSTTFNSQTTPALLAIDSKLSTMSKTREETYARTTWWIGQLKNPTKIKSITAMLNGSYDQIQSEFSTTGASGTWKRCGKTEDNVVAQGLGFKRSCRWKVDNVGETTHVRVKAIPKLNEEGKSSLMIREVQVHALKDDVPDSDPQESDEQSQG